MILLSLKYKFSCKIILAGMVAGEFASPMQHGLPYRG